MTGWTNRQRDMSWIPRDLWRLEAGAVDQATRVRFQGCVLLAFPFVGLESRRVSSLFAKLVFFNLR